MPTSFGSSVADVVADPSPLPQPAAASATTASPMGSARRMRASRLRTGRGGGASVRRVRVEDAVALTQEGTRAGCSHEAGAFVLSLEDRHPTPPQSYACTATVRPGAWQPECLLEQLGLTLAATEGARREHASASTERAVPALACASKLAPGQCVGAFRTSRLRSASGSVWIFPPTSSTVSPLTTRT
jgi:hypothetical protein